MDYLLTQHHTTVACDLRLKVARVGETVVCALGTYYHMVEEWDAQDAADLLEPSGDAAVFV